jgi:hypothetical protein
MVRRCHVFFDVQGDLNLRTSRGLRRDAGFPHTFSQTVRPLSTRPFPGCEQYIDSECGLSF